jgi:hypothetical protein
MSTPFIVPLRRLQISTCPHTPPTSGAAYSELTSPEAELVCANGTWRADLGLRHASDRPMLAELAATGYIVCVIGDADEVNAAPSSSAYANANVIFLDLKGSTVRILTPLTGLPPAFVFRRGDRVTISSPFLPETTRGYLAPDFDGIADTLRWGHPIDGRTLIANLQLVPSFSTLIYSQGAGLEITRKPWPRLKELESLQWAEIVREQVAAFSEAAKRVRAENAFMSLSGGLDSRTSLVALLSHGRRVPCVTMAGSPDNLDVKLAKAFCEPYGLEHHTVLLGEQFYRSSPELLLESADLTGGVASLSQTADLYLYKNVPMPYGSRISGNLGNQVGRGGVESLSAYRPNANVFSQELRARLKARPLSPWFVSRLANDSYAETLFGQEVHYWSIANYMVGSACADQITPYADVRLMQLSCAAFARDRELARPTSKILRARDLRHRLAGVPKASSFQRQFLIRNDHVSNRVPLNWGWRAAGGWSLSWGMVAALSASDAALIKLSSRSGLLRPTASWLSARLHHRSALVDWRRLLRTRLRELTMDTFSTRYVRELGIFDVNALDKILSEHFREIADSHYTIARSLEVALGLSVRAAPHRPSLAGPQIS